MDFQIDKKSNVQINEQIRVQLRYQIINGELVEGNKLPSVREMASFLGINRHTISRAYKDLEDEGLIESRPSFGTYVSKNINLPQKKALEDFIYIVSEAIEKSKSLGFSTAEFISAAQNLYLKEESGQKNVKALFVECNASALNQFVKDLKAELSIDVEGCMLSDIEEGKVTQGELNGQDIIITTLGHYPYLKKMLKGHENIYAINFGPYLHVLNKIKDYHKKASIGIICINEAGSIGLKQVLLDLGIGKGVILEGTTKDLEKVKEIANNVEVLIVSKFALEENRVFFDNLPKDIIEYQNILDGTSIKMLQEVINQIKQTK